MKFQNKTTTTEQKKAKPTWNFSVLRKKNILTNSVFKI